MVLQRFVFQFYNLRRLILSRPIPSFFLFIIIVLLSRIQQEDIETLTPLIPNRIYQSTTNLINCNLNELSSGRWIERIPRFNKINEFLLGTERINMLECEGEDDRILEINNWLFKSEEELHCKRIEWDQIQVVKKLLTMPEGMIIVGDSLGEQFSATFRSLLSINILIEGGLVKGATLPNGSPINLHKTLTLHPKHPIYSEFISKNEFSQSRLKKPLIQFFRSHHLISDEEITSILTPTATTTSNINSSPDELPAELDSLEGVDGLIPSSNNQIESVGRIGYPWGSDPDYMQFVREIMMSYRVLPSDYDIGSLENSSPTVLILSTGPHWHTSHFTHIPPSYNTRGEKELQDPMLLGYSRMVQLILDQLPDSSYLHTIIRSNNPVSESCSAEIAPPLLSSTNEPSTILTGSRYNYDLFPIFDQIWSESILNSRRLRIKRGKVEFWNDFNMMSKRMEAKKGPSKGDCLHFCIPTLYESARILMGYLIES